MARSLSGFDVRLQLEAVLKNSIDGGTRILTVGQGIDYAPSLSDGTTEGKFDLIWSDTNRSLTGATSENIDLYDLGSIDVGSGAGKDAVGLSVAIVEIVGLLIKNRSGSTGTLTIGGEGSAAAWNSPFGASDLAKLGPVGPNGALFLFNPADPAWAVADSSNHLLKIASSDDLAYDIAVAARTA